MIKNLLQSCIWCLLFLGCSVPRVMPELTLMEEAQQWNMGKEVVELSQGDIDFNASFIQSTAFDLLFEVEIANNSDEPIFIDPLEFYLKPKEGPYENPGRIYAYDPESLLFEIEESLEEDKKFKRQTKALGWVFLALDVALTATSIAREEPEALERVINTGFNATALAIEQSAINKHIVRLEGERDYYDNAALRPFELEPYESVSGIVIFPRFDPAQQVKCVFPIENARFDVSYNQRHVKRER